MLVLAACRRKSPEQGAQAGYANAGTELAAIKPNAGTCQGLCRKPVLCSKRELTLCSETRGFRKKFYSKLVTLTRGLSKIHAEDHREPKAFRRHRLDGPMTCHLMPFAPAAELRASCAEKPSPCKELRRLGTFLFHEHHRDISMLSLAHADTEAHHRHRYSPAASGKTLTRYRFNDSRLRHLMAYDRTKLSVSRTLRPSSRTPCVFRRKARLCKELRRLGTSSLHEHHRGISMIPLAHADREAHHRHRCSPPASGKTFRRYRLSGSMLCHLMAYDRTKLSVSQTLRPSSRTPCVLRRKPSPRKELRRLSTSAPMLFLRGPVPSCRGHCSTSEARCPGRRA